MLEVQPQIPIAAVCISDQCAMWQWIPSKTTHKERHVEESPKGNFRAVDKDVPDDPTHGFCGLARGVQ
jgi:hypothetical protein